MKDNLEKYVKENRDLFDDFTPPGDMWDKISNKTSYHKKNNIRRLIVKTSGIAALVLISLLAYQYFKVDSADNYVSNDLMKELLETEHYYNGLVDAKKEMVYSLTSGSPEIKQDVEMELSLLDSAMNEIKNDLKDNISNTEVVEAMIQNYRMKLKILEDILKYIKPNVNEEVEQDSDSANI